MGKRSETPRSFERYAGHGLTPAQRSHSREVQYLARQGKSATSIYNSLKEQGRGMRKVDLLELVGYVKYSHAEKPAPRMAHAENIRKGYGLTGRTLTIAKGMTRKPFEYVVNIGSRKGADGKREKIFVTVASDKALTISQAENKARQLKDRYGIKRSRPKLHLARIGV